jgi:DNA-binding response OmpR family regulator
MLAHTILIIEKDGNQAPTFASFLEAKDYSVEVVTTGARAVRRARMISPALIILNAASLGTSGVRICKQLVEEIDSPLIHIVDEGVVVPDVQGQAGTMVLHLPFTSRKLINRVRRMWPNDNEEIIAGGPVELAVSSRVVRVEGREKRLTPKTANLLKVFLTHPGETLDREFLMRQVWKTDYMGDTRTLDVHVRWVRQAIERDPESPVLVRTIRGLGYRFDPEQGNA